MHICTIYIKNILLLWILILFFNIVDAQSVKILFDASKAETAGNADWVIDAGLHNLGFNNGPAVAGQGTESNPSILPSPSQINITPSTSETFWDGAISNWGVDAVNYGYIVETLPFNGQITYGNSGNAQDLSNYKVFIIPEPNIVFTSAEKTAIINFVQNGGGLFMISDHDQSDRNGDGWDSPHILNDLMTNNTVQLNPFGMSFDYLDFSQTSFNIPSLPLDSILHGPMGSVDEVQWNNGTSITINPALNNSVVGVVYKTGSLFGNNNVLCAHMYFGKGKVAAIADSSPIDDGTGDLNDVLYNGYINDAAGNHRKLLMNITIWLAATSSTGIQNLTNDNHNLHIFPDPVNKLLTFNYPSNNNLSQSITIHDLSGKLLLSIQQTNSNFDKTHIVDISNLKEGIYYLTFISGITTARKCFAVIH